MPRNGTPAAMRSSSVSRTPQGVERAHHLAEVADAGQNDLGRRAQARGIADQRVLAPSSPSVFCTVRRLPAP